MISSRFAYAFSAGLVAAINPCGFALLPTYLAFFLGIDSQGSAASASNQHRDVKDLSRDLGRAILVGIALTAGFITVFSVMGVAWGSLASVVKENIPWASLIIGILLVIVGVAMLAGYEPLIRLPKLDAGGSSRNLGSIYVYGVSYAVASLSCTLPIFASTLTASINTEGVLQTASVVIAYGLGMGVLITALTVATSLARAGLLVKLRQLMPLIGRISGGLLVIAGLFVAWYAWSEIKILDGDGAGENTAFGKVSSWQGNIQNWLGVHQVAVGWTSAVVLAAAVGFIIVQRTRRPNSDNSE